MILIYAVLLRYVAFVWQTLFLVLSLDESFDLFFCKTVELSNFSMCFAVFFQTKDFIRKQFYFRILPRHDKSLLL